MQWDTTEKSRTFETSCFLCYGWYLMRKCSLQASIVTRYYRHYGAKWSLKASHHENVVKWRQLAKIIQNNNFKKVTTLLFLLTISFDKSLEYGNSCYEKWIILCHYLKLLSLYFKIAFEGLSNVWRVIIISSQYFKICCYFRLSCYSKTLSLSSFSHYFKISWSSYYLVISRYYFIISRYVVI